MSTMEKLVELVGLDRRLLYAMYFECTFNCEVL